MEFIFERIISDLTEGYTPPPEAAAAVSLIIFIIFAIMNAGIIYALNHFLNSYYHRKKGEKTGHSQDTDDSGTESAAAKPNLFGRLKKFMAELYARLKLYFRYENTSEDNFSKVIPVIITGLMFAIFAILPWAATHYGQPGQTALAFSELSTGIFFLIAIGLTAPLALAYSARRSLNGTSELIIKYTAISVPWCLSLLGTVIISGSMTAGDIVKAQQAGMFGSPLLGWFIVPSILGAACYIYCASAAAELPWSLKSSDQECGIQTGIMNICELTLLFAASAYFTDFFLGGWSLPWFYPPNQAELGIAVIPYFDLMCGLTVFFIKTYGLIAAAIWIKLNYAEKISQILRQYEKYLYPAAVGNIIICSLAAALQQTLGGNL